MMIWIRIGILLAGISVFLGGYGAHGLENQVATSTLNVYLIGVRYQFYHALSLLGYGLFLHHFSIKSYWTGILFTLGIIIFSGSLYLFTFTGDTFWGIITPIGGGLLICGWIRFFFITFKKLD